MLVVWFDSSLTTSFVAVLYSSEWDDWLEDDATDGLKLCCPFCSTELEPAHDSEQDERRGVFLYHLHSEHSIDVYQHWLDGSSDIYAAIKLVNRIIAHVCRSTSVLAVRFSSSDPTHLHAQAKQRCCITCEAVFDSSELLLQHMQQQGHFECGSHGGTGDHDDDDKYAPLPSHHYYLSIYLPMLL